MLKLQSKKNKLLTKALIIRRLEEGILDLFIRGKIHGTTHTCIGQEIIPVCISEFMQKKDVIISNHRNHGHFLAMYPDKANALVAEMLGLANGINGGFSGSQHIHHDRFFASGLQGGLLPYALGIAWSKKTSKKKDLVICYLGDGTFGEGIVYECFNIASKLQLPIIFVVEDNKYSQSTQQTENLSGTIRGRAQAFDIKYYSANSFALQPLLTATKNIFSYVRSKGNPAVFQIETYRLSPHSKGDDTRDPQEIERFQKKDLINIFSAQPFNKKIVTTTKATVQRIFKSTACHSQKNIPVRRLSFNKNYSMSPMPAPPKGFITQHINTALHHFFKKSKNAIFLGEDIRDPYGGAFKISKGLSTKYPTRIFNMPISESAIVGMGFGTASVGIPTLVELMFGDFITLAFDQFLNQISKSEVLTGKKNMPLLIRAPMGGGRGYGFTHSQSLEKFLYAIPNMNIFLLNCWLDIPLFYKNTLNQLKTPSFVIEYKKLYATEIKSAPVGYEAHGDGARQSMIILTPLLAADMTVVVFGGISLEIHEILPALLSEEIYVDVFSPVDLHGCSIELIAQSVSKTKKIIFVEEGTKSSNISCDFFRKIMMTPQLHEKPKVKFIHASDFPSPSAPRLERQVIPSAEFIFEKCLELFNE